MRALALVPLVALAPACHAESKSAASVTLLAPTAVRLTWVLHPKIDEPAKQTQKFVVELVVRAGSTTRRFSTMQLGTDRQSTYTFDIDQQAACGGHQPPEVASLWLGGGGYVKYVVKRIGDELIVSKEDICALGASDGKCDPDPSPTKPGTLARMPIPHDATIEERFRVVDDDQHEHEARCPPKSP